MTATATALEAPADVQRHMYELMMLMQATDDRLFKGVATGEFVCPLWPARGQEAIPAGFASCLRRDDHLVTTYRGIHDMIGKGVPLVEILGEALGKQVGGARGKGGLLHLSAPDHGVKLVTGIVGSGVPVAVGLGLAAKMQQRDRVVVVSFGDGATCTGSFHEGANMAALWDLPVVLVCQNNLYAEHTPTSATMKITQVADRATAYGMPGARIDGNDPLAVRAAVNEAVDRARSGGGPTFLECMTFRFRGHSRGDNMKYIPAEQLQAAIAADPVPRYRARLLADGICSAAELDEIDARARAEVDEAIAVVNASDPPADDELTRDVYASPLAYPTAGWRSGS